MANKYLFIMILLAMIAESSTKSYKKLPEGKLADQYRIAMQTFDAGKYIVADPEGLQLSLHRSAEEKYYLSNAFLAHDTVFEVIYLDPVPHQNQIRGLLSKTPSFVMKLGFQETWVTLYDLKKPHKIFANHFDHKLPFANYKPGKYEIVPERVLAFQSISLNSIKTIPDFLLERGQIVTIKRLAADSSRTRILGLVANTHKIPIWITLYDLNHVGTIYVRAYFGKLPIDQFPIGTYIVALDKLPVSYTLSASSLFWIEDCWLNRGDVVEVNKVSSNWYGSLIRGRLTKIPICAKGFKTAWITLYQTGLKIDRIVNYSHEKKPKRHWTCNACLKLNPGNVNDLECSRCLRKRPEKSKKLADETDFLTGDAFAQKKF